MKWNFWVMTNFGDSNTGTARGLSIHYRENYCQITVRKKKGSRNTNDEKMDRKWWGHLNIFLSPSLGLGRTENWELKDNKCFYLQIRSLSLSPSIPHPPCLLFSSGPCSVMRRRKVLIWFPVKLQSTVYSLAVWILLNANWTDGISTICIN